MTRARASARLLFVLPAAALTIALSACGGDGDVDPAAEREGLPASVVADVERARDKIKRYCNDVGSADVSEAVNTLIAVYRRFPDRTFESGDVPQRATMRDVVARQADRLGRCGATRASRRLRNALRR